MATISENCKSEITDSYDYGEIAYLLNEGNRQNSLELDNYSNDEFYKITSQEEKFSPNSSPIERTNKDKLEFHEDNNIQELFKYYFDFYYDGDKIVLGPNYKNIQLSQAISNEFKNHFENRSKELKELLFYRGKNYEKAEVKERKHEGHWPGGW